MGLRTEPKAWRESIRSPNTCLTVWYTTAAHLTIQRILDDVSDDIHQALTLLQSLSNKPMSEWPVFLDILTPLTQFCRGEYHYATSANGIPCTNDSTIQEILAAGINKTWAPVMYYLIPPKKDGDPKKWQAQNRFWERMRGFFLDLEKVDATLAEAETKEFEEIPRLIAQGQPVTQPPWTLISEQMGGCPTAEAILWTRQILRGVTEHFAGYCRKKPHAVSICRNENMGYNHMGHGSPESGIFVDFIGGVFTAGHKERQDYLKVRLAAIESLASLSERVLAGPIGQQFLKQRRYLRKPGKKHLGHTGQRTLLHASASRSSPNPLLKNDPNRHQSLR